MHDPAGFALAVAAITGFVLWLIAWLLLVIRLGPLIGWGPTLATGFFMPPALVVLGIANFAKARMPTLIALFAFVLLLSSGIGLLRAASHRPSFVAVAVAMEDEFGPRGRFRYTDGVFAVRLPSRPTGDPTEQRRRIEEIVRAKYNRPVTRVVVRRR